MSRRQAGDWSQTKSQVKKRSGPRSRRNWLRHGIYTQAAKIDELLLVGASVGEIAKTLRSMGLSSRGQTTTEARVRNHLNHLTNEHKLKLSNHKGIRKFDLGPH